MEVCKQSLHERFNAKLTFLIRAVLEEVLALNSQGDFAWIKDKAFKTIRIKDSTSFQLPDSIREAFAGSGGSSSKSGIKIQFEYDYLTGRIYQLVLCDGKSSDLSNSRETIDSLSKDELTLTDLGYVEIHILPQIEKRQAYYLFRLPTSVDVYRKKGQGYKKIDFQAIERFMKTNGLEVFELEVYVGKKQRHFTRLIIELVPEQIKHQRIRAHKKQAKSRGRTVKKSVLACAGLNLFITNLGKDELHITQARKLYRLRWQVELIFKLWKSIGKIHCVQKMKADRFISCLYAKLLWFFMNWNVLWIISNHLFFSQKPRLISFYKAFKSLSRKKDCKYSIISQDIEQIDAFIATLVDKVERYYLFEKKKGKLSSLEILLQYQTGFEKKNI